MSKFSVGDEVYLRDRSMGRPLKVKGSVVGFFLGDNYAILMCNGLNEGRVMKYNYRELFLVDEEGKML